MRTPPETPPRDSLAHGPHTHQETMPPLNSASFSDESKPLGGDQELRTSTLARHRPIQGDSDIDLENQKGLFHHLVTRFPDASDAINDFWTMSGKFIYRHHVEPRVKLSPREESFPIPLKYIDFSRTTQTNLDVKQEKRIDNYVEHRWVTILVRSLDRFHTFSLLEEKPPDGHMLVGGRLTRKTACTDHLWQNSGSQWESTPKKPFRNARREVGNISRCALQNYEEKLWEWWIQQN